MRKKILYLSYNGMMEPLGASQVLSYVTALSKNYDFHLISLEKKIDLENENAINKLDEKLKGLDIKWHPLVYSSSTLGKHLNFLRFTIKSYRVISSKNISFVHARSYFPALSCYLINKVKNIKYLFDTRGFAFDERADVGSVKRSGIIFKLLKKIEKLLYKNASGINKLSHVGKSTILNNELFEDGDSLENISVIPTCVDLDRFAFHERDYKAPFTIGYVGTAVGWYDFDKTVSTLKSIMNTNEVFFKVFNKGQHDFIKDKLITSGIESSKFSIEEVPFTEMPSRLDEFDAALFFIHPYFSKRASAATKLGELFASGIPVITNPNVGDHEYYINEYKTGKIIDFDQLDHYDFNSIFNEIVNKETSLKCRNVATKYFSLEKGVEEYEKIYTKIFI